METGKWRPALQSRTDRSLWTGPERICAVPQKDLDQASARLVTSEWPGKERSTDRLLDHHWRPQRPTGDRSTSSESIYDWALSSPLVRGFPCSPPNTLGWCGLWCCARPSIWKWFLDTNEGYRAAQLAGHPSWSRYKCDRVRLQRHTNGRMPPCRDVDSLQL